MSVRVDDKGKYFTPRVNKDPIPAVIRTVDHLIVGNVYSRPAHRLKDELNNSTERFLAVTDASVYDARGENLLYESELLFVSFEHVVLIGPTDAVRGGNQATWLRFAMKEDV